LFITLSFHRDPPSATAARLDSVSLPLPKKKLAAPSAPARADRPFRGIALVLASTIFLGCSDVTAKYLSATLPSIEIAWIRFLVFAMIMVPAMLPGTRLFALQSERPGLQVMRGVALLSSSLFFISGTAFPPDRGGFRHRLHRAAVSSPHCRSPFSAKSRRPPLAGDDRRIDRVLIILRPGSSAFHPAAFFPIVSALAWACTLIMTRMMSGKERVISTMNLVRDYRRVHPVALVPLVWGDAELA